MDVLIIGGSGLISTAIGQQLVDQGHRVTCFNRAKTPNRITGPVEIIAGDRQERAAFEAALSARRFDVVVDMIAFTVDDVASTVRAVGGRCGQLIHCSTVCVYSGPVTQIPTTETEPFHSVGTYGKNKIACEEFLMREHAERKLPVTIMRPSHSYGEVAGFLRPFGPGSTLVARMRAGRPIIVNDGGNSVWASCHVEDVARGFIGTMGNARCLGQAYNVCGYENMTWNQYLEQIAEVVGGSYAPVYIPTEVLKVVTPKWVGGTWEIFAWPSIFDSSKLKRDAAWRGQTIAWKEGVRRTLAWQEAHGGLKGADGEPFEDTLIAAWQRQIAGLPVTLEPWKG
jgi:nucleoside-diphosphate-sugar epimerase